MKIKSFSLYNKIIKVIAKSELIKKFQNILLYGRVKSGLATSYEDISKQAEAVEPSRAARTNQLTRTSHAEYKIVLLILCPLCFGFYCGKNYLVYLELSMASVV